MDFNESTMVGALIGAGAVIVIEFLFALLLGLVDMMSGKAKRAKEQVKVESVRVEPTKALVQPTSKPQPVISVGVNKQPKPSSIVSMVKPSDVTPPAPIAPKPARPFDVRYRYTVDSCDKTFTGFRDAVRQVDADYAKRTLGKHISYDNIPVAIRVKIHRERVN